MAKALPPAFLFKRAWRNAFNLKKDGSNIEGLGSVNVVFHVTTQESPSTAYNRILIGTSTISPPVNRRKVYSNKDLQLLSNTDQASAFVHVCLKCTGQHGKILRFEDYLIRIGRYTLAQALLNVVRFQLFSNTKVFTGLSVLNMVITGQFKDQLDRESLIKDPQAVSNKKFKGIS